MLLLLPPPGSRLVSVALKRKMEHCSLLLPFSAFGVCCFLPGGARVVKALGSCFAGREAWDPVTLVMVKMKLFWNALPRSPCALRRRPSTISCSARKHRKVRLFFFLAVWRQTNHFDERTSVQSPPEVLHFGHPCPEATLVKFWKWCWTPVLQQPRRTHGGGNSLFGFAEELDFKQGVYGLKACCVFFLFSWAWWACPFPHTQSSSVSPPASHCLDSAPLLPQLSCLTYYYFLCSII